MFKPKFRIVRYGKKLYRIQTRKWWNPFWKYYGGFEYFYSVEDAEDYIKSIYSFSNPRNTVVKYVEV